MSVQINFPCPCCEGILGTGDAAPFIPILGTIVESLIPGHPKSQGKSFRCPLKGRLGEIQRRPLGIGEDKILA